MFCSRVKVDNLYNSPNGLAVFWYGAAICWLGSRIECPAILRWLETVFHFPFQLNFMKGLLVYNKRLLLLVDSWCCNNLSTYQLLYSHWHFGCHGNLTGPQIHPISSIQLHFTQKVVGELPFLLHQKCLHIKDHFLRKFKKILSRGFGATLIFCNMRIDLWVTFFRHTVRGQGR